MKKIVLIVIAVILLTTGGFLFFSLNQKSRNEMHLRMTEISAETDRDASAYRNTGPNRNTGSAAGDHGDPGNRT